MLAKVIFFAAVAAAVLAVILLATVSPLPARVSRDRDRISTLSLSLYIGARLSLSHPILTDPDLQRKGGGLQTNNAAFVFHRNLLEGPERASRVVGKVRGFLLPTNGSATAAFNILHVELDISSDCRGSLSLEAAEGTGEELRVVGGTKSFAFARGTAVVVPVRGWPADGDATYQFKLRLRLLDEHITIPAG